MRRIATILASAVVVSWSGIAVLMPTAASAHPTIAPLEVSSGKTVTLTFSVPFEPVESVAPVSSLRVSIPPSFELASASPPFQWSQSREGSVLVFTAPTPTTAGAAFRLVGTFTTKAVVAFPMDVVAADGTQVKWDGSPPLAFTMSVGAGVPLFPGAADPTKNGVTVAQVARIVGIVLVAGGAVAMAVLFLRRRRSGLAG